MTEASATELAEELRNRLHNNGHKRIMLGVVGYPGAGKSTVSAALVHHVNELCKNDVAIVVPMDGYHHPNERLIEMELLALKGIPETFDAISFVSLLERLRVDDGPVHAPLFDRSIETSIQDAIEIKPTHRLLVVEGNYLLLRDPPWHKVRPTLDEVWFIDTTLETILGRLIDRHQQGGKTRKEAERKVADTDMRNAHLIDATKIFADRLVAVKL